MIAEVHGDVCRLGYLKLIACILEDGSPRSPDYLASVLLETCRSLVDDVGEMLGMLRTEVNARNYVKLAAQLGFYDRSSGRPGIYGAAYICLNSSEALRRHVSGEGTANLSEVLTLTDVEKTLFLHALLSRDYIFSGMLRWLAEVREFSRLEAMYAVMEEVYPAVLEKMLRRLPEKRRASVQRELEQARGFREERLKYASQAEWIKSRLYAKYRHFVPPRLEWLVDIGFLERVKRARYRVSQRFLKNAQELSDVFEKPVERIDQIFFTSFVPLFHGLRIGGQRAESQALLDAYRVLHRALGKVKLNVLCLAAAYRLLEEGYRSTPASVSRTFSYLSLIHSDRVFTSISDDGSPEVTLLDIPAVE
ncbi:MAG: hypothetical protein QW683_05680 [Candidatus Caldarchaeum sp.]